MFGRLHMQRSSDWDGGERERFDIELSGFQALQIPKGWDRLGLSIVSVESGKTVRKTARAVVWNGSCQWTESVSESVWMNRGETAKDAEGCQLRIIVTSGSSRSNFLGEASINLANYVEASGSIPVSLQLSKCSYGTILQMKARCLSSKPMLGDEQTITDLNSSYEELAIEYDELDGRTEGLENTSIVLPPNFRSSLSRLRKSNSKDTCSSASVSGGSFGSWEGNGSDKDTGSHYSSGRQNSGGTRVSSADEEFVKPNGPYIRSKQQGSALSYQNQNREIHSSLPFAKSPLRSAASSKELKEFKAVEVSVEELRAEARMWERNARKLMSDMDILRGELSEQGEQREILGSELSASREECNSLRQENERINVVLEELTKKQTTEENDAEEFRKAMEEEIKFQKERNTDLASQLKKTQDSNIELLSVLQEFEETIDAQRAEIDAILSEKQIEGSTMDSRVSELKYEIMEKEMLASRQTAVLISKLDLCKEQMEVLVLNYTLAYLDSALYTLENGQMDQHEGSNSIPELRKCEAFSAVTLSEVNDTERINSHEEEETDALKSKIKDLEGRIHSFEVEKSSISCACFGGSHGEKTPIDSINSSSVSVDKFLITTVRVDTYNNELEDRLSELEGENMWLSERIVGLEAQLRYLMNEKESTVLSLQNSESLCLKLENDIRKLESDIEVMGIDAKQKLLVIQVRLSASVDESGRLKVANSKLQDDNELLIEKYGFLDKVNEELKKKNTELHEEYAVLEAEVSEYRELFLRVSTGVEALEESFASLTEETALKEKVLRSEVNALLREDGKINKNIADESVRSSNVKTTDDIVISQQNEEVLMVEREKLLDLLEEAKAKEKQLKNTVRRLHVALKGSEYENLQLLGEIKSEEIRLRQMESLRKEVSSLRRGISEAIFEKERLEASNQVLLEQYEEMESEKESLVRKISSVQKALTEVEHSRNTKAALEEKILRLEGDLTAREALFAHDAEQRNELARTRIANGELQRRIKCLHDENHEYRTRIQQLRVPSESETLSWPSKGIRSGQNEGRLEKELVDLRESYSALSLKYAQAEAHREQLLLKLRD